MHCSIRLCLIFPSIEQNVSLGKVIKALYGAGFIGDIVSLL